MKALYRNNQQARKYLQHNSMHINNKCTNVKVSRQKPIDFGCHRSECKFQMCPKKSRLKNEEEKAAARRQVNGYELASDFAIYQRVFLDLHACYVIV